MKTVGIVAEYNPFHNGHLYHLTQARNAAKADYVVVLMSGDFTQRGTPACLDKFTRARMALINGADLVLELPLCYASSSAETFAEGAISLLSQSGCIDTLCFGAEPVENTVSPKAPFLAAASFFAEEPAAYRSALKAGLKEGLPFPLARHEAAKEFLPSEALALLASPNNLLGIEYCKALLRLSSPISPLPIMRLGNDYHDKELPAKKAGAPILASATAIRAALHAGSETNRLPAALLDSIPENCLALFSDAAIPFMQEEDFFPLLRYRLLYGTETLTAYLDISRELADRITHTTLPYSYEALVAALKTRQYTRTRIERALLHLLLDIKTDEFFNYREKRTGYLRILGFRKEAAPLLKAMKANTSIPVITKLAAAKKALSKDEYALLLHDIRAARLYNGEVCKKYGVLPPDDYAYIVII